MKERKKKRRDLEEREIKRFLIKVSAAGSLRRKEGRKRVGEVLIL